MILSNRPTWALFALFVISTTLFGGCGTKEPQPNVAKTTVSDEHDHDHEHEHANAEHGHDDWWCVEHGVPEEVCTRCSPKLAAAFQKKGDWCEEHSLPDSQCFKCHPELEAKFAAQYEAKFGKKPPKPTE